MKRSHSKILIVDDYPMVREWLSQLIDHQPDLRTCGQAADVREALEAVARLHPDLVVVDLTLRDGHGMELIKDIAALYPEMRMLVFSVHEESVLAERALRAGAHGYIMKQELSANVLKAIRHVLAGQVYLSEPMMTKMAQRLVGGKAQAGQSPLQQLSDREAEIYQLIGQGHGTRQIAEELHLDPRTVETYRSRIKMKLNLASTTELLRHAFQSAKTEFHPDTESQ